MQAQLSTPELFASECVKSEDDWEEPSDRAVNAGTTPYEEITVFFLSQPDDVPQPDAP